MANVQVIGIRPCLYVNRVQVALNLKRISYEFLEEKLGQKSDLLLKLNPLFKKVSIFIHNGQPICESINIVQYIVNVWSFGLSILPSDPYDRANARFWATYVEDKWSPILVELRTAKGDDQKASAKERLVESSILLENVCTKCSEGKCFFGGDSIGYLDIVLGCFLGWLKVTEKIANLKLLDETSTPNLAIWAEKFCSHEAVKDVIPSTEELMEIWALSQGKIVTV